MFSNRSLNGLHQLDPLYRSVSFLLTSIVRHLFYLLTVYLLPEIYPVYNGASISHRHLVLTRYFELPCDWYLQVIKFRVMFLENFIWKGFAGIDIDCDMYSMFPNLCTSCRCVLFCYGYGKIQSLFLDFIFKVLLFRAAFPIFSAIVLFLLNFFWLVCYCNKWLYFSQGLVKLKYILCELTMLTYSYCLQWQVKSVGSLIFFFFFIHFSYFECDL